MSGGKPKSPTGDVKTPPGMVSPSGGMHKSQSFEFESAPPASMELENDESEMQKVLKNPPVEARSEPAWKAYVDIGYISAADVNVWTEFISCAPDDLEAHLSERGPLIVQAFLKMLTNIQSAEARKYILTVLDQCCITNKRRWGALFNNHLKPREEVASPKYKESAKEKEKEQHSILYSAKEQAAAAAAAAAHKSAAGGIKIEEKRLSPFAPFFLILRQETLDAYTQARVLHILATLFVHGATVPRPGSGKTGTQVASEIDELKEFVRYLILKLSTPPHQAKPREAMLVLLTTKELLKNPDVRRMFVDFGGLRALEQHFKNEHETRNTQFTYVASFIVWLLSYNKDLSVDLKAWGVVAKVNKIITATNREKVLRLGFAIMANIVTRENFAEELISLGVVKFIDAMGGRKIKDDDLIKDIDAVRQALEEATAALSSYEKYTKEVDSGELQWSPVHTEQFWRENAIKFEASSFEYVKKVAALLDRKSGTPEADRTLQVACADLGEFARFHPDGKRILARDGAKNKLMKLMSDKQTPPKVASAALLAVQKLMVNNWEHLAPGKSKTGGKGDE